MQFIFHAILQVPPVQSSTCTETCSRPAGQPPPPPPPPDESGVGVGVAQGWIPVAGRLGLSVAIDAQLTPEQRLEQGRRMLRVRVCVKLVPMHLLAVEGNHALQLLYVQDVQAVAQELLHGGGVVPHGLLPIAIWSSASVSTRGQVTPAQRLEQVLFISRLRACANLTPAHSLLVAGDHALQLSYVQAPQADAQEFSHTGGGSMGGGGGGGATGGGTDGEGVPQSEATLPL